MERADVAVVGGGPAGSACAARLVAGGARVVVVDRARFPRDKPCAGWITPEVVEALELDLAGYGEGRTLQGIRRFRVGWAFGPGREIDYGIDVSYGIRRCEFDAYLLARSGARLFLGEGVQQVRRERDHWVLDGRVEAPLLVGAGGHFCPVARVLRDSSAPSRADQRAADRQATVIAQEMEIGLTPEQAERCPVEAGRPELDFLSDLSGYGWCFRKGRYLNVGFGRRGPSTLPREARAYLDWLVARGRLPAGLPAPLRGHAYRLREGRPGPIADRNLVLVGDAAGLAFAASGEGIYPAVVSGQLAAEMLMAGYVGEDGGRSYAERLSDRLGPPSSRPALPGSLRAAAGRALLGSSWLTRHVVLDRLFLHRHAPPS
jgi:flavin-dependent dehydrogenase